VSNLTLAAAGDNVHAVWRAGAALITRRLEAATTTWTAEAPLETVTGVQEFCLAGGSNGGLLLTWTASNAVDAQLYSASTDTWGTTAPLLAAGDSIGYGSLACAMDPRGRATVAWTVWDPVASSFSAFERTYR